jgi:hypothetical protein
MSTRSTPQLGVGATAKQPGGFMVTENEILRGAVCTGFILLTFICGLGGLTVIEVQLLRPPAAESVSPPASVRANAAPASTPGGESLTIIPVGSHALPVAVALPRLSVLSESTGTNFVETDVPMHAPQLPAEHLRVPIEHVTKLPTRWSTVPHGTASPS